MLKTIVFTLIAAGALGACAPKSKPFNELTPAEQQHRMAMAAMALSILRQNQPPAAVPYYIPPPDQPTRLNTTCHTSHLGGMSTTNCY